MSKKEKLKIDELRKLLPDPEALQSERNKLRDALVARLQHWGVTHGHRAEVEAFSAVNKYLDCWETTQLKSWKATTRGRKTMPLPPEMKNIKAKAEAKAEEKAEAKAKPKAEAKPKPTAKQTSEPTPTKLKEKKVATNNTSSTSNAAPQNTNQNQKQNQKQQKTPASLSPWLSSPVLMLLFDLLPAVDMHSLSITAKWLQKRVASKTLKPFVRKPRETLYSGFLEKEAKDSPRLKCNTGSVKFTPGNPNATYDERDAIAASFADVSGRLDCHLLEFEGVGDKCVPPPISALLLPQCQPRGVVLIGAESHPLDLPSVVAQRSVHHWSFRDPTYLQKNKDFYSRWNSFFNEVSRLKASKVAFSGLEFHSTSWSKEDEKLQPPRYSETTGLMLPHPLPEATPAPFSYTPILDRKAREGAWRAFAGYGSGETEDENDQDGDKAFSDSDGSSPSPSPSSFTSFKSSSLPSNETWRKPWQGSWEGDWPYVTDVYILKEASMLLCPEFLNNRLFPKLQRIWTFTLAKVEQRKLLQEHLKALNIQWMRLPYAEKRAREYEEETQEALKDDGYQFYHDIVFAPELCQRESALVRQKSWGKNLAQMPYAAQRKSLCKLQVQRSERKTKDKPASDSESDSDSDSDSASDNKDEKEKTKTKTERKANSKDVKITKPHPKRKIQIQEKADGSGSNCNSKPKKAKTAQPKAKAKAKAKSTKQSKPAKPQSKPQAKPQPKRNRVVLVSS